MSVAGNRKNLPKIVRGFAETRVQPDAPVMGNQQVMANQSTQSLFWRAKPATRSFIWQPAFNGTALAKTIVSYGAPHCTMTSGSWVDFQFGNPSTAASLVDLQIPWLFTTDFDDIEVVCKIISNAPLPIQLRASANTLVTSVATTNSAVSPAVICEHPMEQYQWQRFRSLAATKTFEPRHMKYGWGVCTIKSPTMPADNRVAIKVEARLSMTTSPAEQLSDNHYAYLANVLIREKLDEDNG